VAGSPRKEGKRGGRDGREREGRGTEVKEHRGRRKRRRGRGENKVKEGGKIDTPNIFRRGCPPP